MQCRHWFRNKQNKFLFKQIKISFTSYSESLPTDWILSTKPLAYKIRLGKSGRTKLNTRERVKYQLVPSTNALFAYQLALELLTGKLKLHKESKVHLKTMK